MDKQNAQEKNGRTADKAGNNSEREQTFYNKNHKKRYVKRNKNVEAGKGERTIDNQGAKVIANQVESEA